MKGSKLTIEALRRVLSYEPSTGAFRWLVATSNRAVVGAEAGVIAQNGRRYISVFAEKHLAHRLAWFYVHGVWPKGNVAPKNGDPLDVRIDNLIEEDPTVTASKSKARSTNSSGAQGVSWSKQKQKWVATITRDHKRVHIGYFDSIESAAAAYEAATKELPEKRYAKAKTSIERANERWLWKLWRQVSIAGEHHIAWKSFEIFAADVGPLPCAGCSISRKDETQPVGPQNFVITEPSRSDWAEWCRTDRVSNPEKYRNKQLIKDFGIDVAEYQRMFVEQKGVCAICEQPETETRGDKVKWLAVDHDHVTGAVRALLCHACNKAYGLMKEDPAIFEKAIAYAHKHARPENVVPLKPKENTG